VLLVLLIFWLLIHLKDEHNLESTLYLEAFEVLSFLIQVFFSFLLLLVQVSFDSNNPVSFCAHFPALFAKVPSSVQHKQYLQFSKLTLLIF
jgi:hypothetical protein